MVTIKVNIHCPNATVLTSNTAMLILKSYIQGLAGATAVALIMGHKKLFIHPSQRQSHVIENEKIAYGIAITCAYPMLEEILGDHQFEFHAFLQTTFTEESVLFGTTTCKQTIEELPISSKCFKVLALTDGESTKSLMDLFSLSTTVSKGDRKLTETIQVSKITLCM